MSAGAACVAGASGPVGSGVAVGAVAGAIGSGAGATVGAGSAQFSSMMSIKKCRPGSCE